MRRACGVAYDGRHHRCGQRRAMFEHDPLRTISSPCRSSRRGGPRPRPRSAGSATCSAARPRCRTSIGASTRSRRRSATVLITGESGSGKEVVARTIHENERARARRSSPSTAARFRANLIEAELFGYEKGAFTGAARTHRGCFERADGGTLFLDEITEMAPEMQVRLLRVLETGRYHARRRRAGTAGARAHHRRDQPRSRGRRCATASCART